MSKTYPIRDFRGPFPSGVGMTVHFDCTLVDAVAVGGVSVDDVVESFNHWPSSIASVHNNASHIRSAY